VLDSNKKKKTKIDRIYWVFVHLNLSILLAVLLSINIINITY